MPEQIRIIIADDHNLFIDGLCLLLKEEEDMQVVGVANDGKELLDILPSHDPDIILLDINMPKLNGLATINYIRRTLKHVGIIMISTYNEDHLVEKAKKEGASGYLLKNSSKEELLQTIRLVNAGQACFPYRAPQPENNFNETDRFLKQFSLTKREREVLQLIKEENTNQEISGKLFLSIYTVETHRKNIMQKLGLSGPAALMKFIVENSL